MQKLYSSERALLFLLLVLILSLPFYYIGYYSPTNFPLLDLPMSFFMILVPFGLALYEAQRLGGRAGIRESLQQIGDWRQSQPIALLLPFILVPLCFALSHFSQGFLGLPIADTVPINWFEVLLLFGIYFIGAIPEELGWTYTITPALSQRYGITLTGILIGSVWGLWHVIPWAWMFGIAWTMDKLLATITFRMLMVLLHEKGGRSLFVAICFHAVMNTVETVIPDAPQNINSLLVAAWALLAYLMLNFFWGKKQ